MVGKKEGVVFVNIRFAKTSAGTWFHKNIMQKSFYFPLADFVELALDWIPYS